MPPHGYTGSGGSSASFDFALPDARPINLRASEPRPTRPACSRPPRHPPIRIIPVHGRNVAVAIRQAHHRVKRTEQIVEITKTVAAIVTFSLLNSVVRNVHLHCNIIALAIFVNLILAATYDLYPQRIRRVSFEYIWTLPPIQYLPLQTNHPAR